jgi:hypothetical protein
MAKSLELTIAERRRADAEFVRSAMMWPVWPYLPVKRKDNSLKDKNLGILYATEELVKKGKPTVYHLYLFDLPRDKKLSDPSIPKTEYESVEAMLDDGWMVD